MSIRSNTLPMGRDLAPELQDILNGEDNLHHTVGEADNRAAVLLLKQPGAAGDDIELVVLGGEALILGELGGNGLRAALGVPDDVV